MTLPLPPDADGKKIKLVPFEDWEKEKFPGDPALDDIPQGQDGRTSVKDFYAVMPTHTYIYTPNREMWPAASINARIPPIPVCDDEGAAFLMTPRY